MKKTLLILLSLILLFTSTSIVYSDLTALPGWPVTLTRDAGQVLVSDIDKDGDNEVIVGDGDYVYIFTSTGVQQDYTWDAGGMLQSLGDVNNDGYDEIAAPDFGKMVLLDYNLNILPGWPKGVPGAPVEAVLADLDGDGNREIIYGETSWYMYVRRGDGSDFPGWPYYGTGIKIVAVVGRLINEIGDKKITNNMSSYIYTWNYNGSVYKTWPASITKFSRNNLTPMSPVYADIDNDGEYEIIYGSPDQNVYAWNSDGTLAKGFPYKFGGGTVSPSIGDLDGDGHLEIVVGDRDGWVYCVKGDGTSLKGWPIKVWDAGIENSAVIGDLDGDGDQEIFFGSPKNAWHHDGTEVANWTFTSGVFIATTPTICDLDKDGDLDIGFGSMFDEVYFFTTGTSYNPENIEWPMFHHDKFRTGNYNSPLLNSPKNKTKITDTTPELVSWNAENFNYDIFTYTYSFYVYSDSGFNTVIDSITGVVEGTNTTSWTVTVPLQDDTRYYWRARPHNGTHYEHWMPIGEFFVNQSNQPPGMFHLVSPSDNSTVPGKRPRLKWTASIDPDGDDFLTYTVEYSIYPDFRSYKSIEGIEDIKYRFEEDLIDGEIYYWRVKVADSSGEERLSDETFKFFVKTGNLDRIKVYPNPVKGGDKITFENIVTGTTIKIFNISGELISSLSENDEDGFLIWNLKNKSGNKVSSGVYIFQIEYAGNIRIVKAAVIK